MAPGQFRCHHKAVANEVWADKTGSTKDEQIERRGCASDFDLRRGAGQGGQAAGEQHAAGGGGCLEEVATIWHDQACRTRPDVGQSSACQKNVRLLTRFIERETRS